MRKICFITGTRADYGILRPVMRIIDESQEAKLSVIATHMHLSPRFGMTVEMIERDGFPIDAKIESMADEDSPAGMVKSMALVQNGLADCLPEINPDLVVLLGDRYETLAAACATAAMGIPIAHLHGGETTEGALDDLFRHAITKLSTLHFAATPLYASRIIKMGEDPKRVFHSGGPGALPPDPAESGLENEFFSRIGISNSDRFILAAMHPVTKSSDNGISETEELLVALTHFVKQGYNVIFTLPNSDHGNNEIAEKIRTWKIGMGDKVFCVESLGSTLFNIALMKAEVMVGNSSAALIEAPSRRLPSVNVGNRQKGRDHGPSVINSPATSSEIIKAIEKALSPDFNSFINSLSIEELNPYYKPDSAQFIADRLIHAHLPEVKPFYESQGF